MRKETPIRFTERAGRLVSTGTAWWLDHAPKAYRYYCIHSVLLTEECRKCERKVTR